MMFERGGGKAEKYFLFGFNDSLHTDAEVVARAKRRLLEGNGNLLRDELEYMTNVFARCSTPNGISSPQRAAFEQSISVLKMAQVSDKEIFPKSVGQVLASLPPGGWNIAWVRDGMYSVLGMNRVGLFREARDFLAFCLNAKSNQFVKYTHTDGKDYGVGVPYQISVCRYFGIGKEESDFGEVNGPNIELDGFGLFLIALGDYVHRSNDTAFFKEYYEILSEKVADPILYNIDTNDLIRLDSGPWERHLPGKQFAYTSIACAAGLRDFSGLISKLNAGDSTKYRQGYERILKGLRSHLVFEDRLVKGNFEATNPDEYDFFDGGTVEAFGFGLLRDAAFCSSHLRAYDKALRAPSGNGFSRINKGDWYEVAEWSLLDLRTASVMNGVGKKKEARSLLKWVTDQAALNNNLIPELFHPKTSVYDGAIPMVGFGAGAYLIALSDLYGTK
jgi:GH15 family glucan-1,4-alpha-glucosidase